MRNCKSSAYVTFGAKLFFRDVTHPIFFSEVFLCLQCPFHRAFFFARFAVGAVASIGWLSQRHSSKHPYTSNAAASSDIPSPASPTLPIRVIRPNPRLEIVFDVRTRTPIYVMESLTKDSLAGRKQRGRPQFYEEPSIDPPEYRSKLAHYRNSGLDRGHMAPAADFSGEESSSTFTLCNVSPQDHAMNVSIWNRLEECG